MIYLSCLELDPRSPWARADLRNPYQLHRTLSKGFGEDKERYQEARCLFRAEERPEGWRVLVQSRLEPDWSSLEGNRRYLADAAQVKALELRFAEGQRLRFLLLANPTRREAAGNATDSAGRSKDGPRRALVFPDAAASKVAQRDWLIRKGEIGGFEPLHFAVEDRGIVRVQKNPSTTIPYAAIRFEGLLQVTDPDRFLETLETGIGTAKGFGFGLLSVAPAN